MKCLLHRIGTYLNKPRVRLAMGFIYLNTGILEVFEIATEEFLGFNMKAQHGLMIFGINQILISCTHIIDGLETIECVENEKS